MNTLLTTLSTLSLAGLLLTSAPAALAQPAGPNSAANASPATKAPEPPDPYLWLEDVSGDKALAWVRERNAITRERLTRDPIYTATRDRLRSQLDAADRIPQVTRRGDWLYDLWRDGERPRGLWRRTTMEEFRKAAPAWEPVLDLDALAKSENENWVWDGATCLPPAHRRCLLALSRGGADATVVREFDTVDKRFVEGGFNLPEAKTQADWADADTLYVATDNGPGSLTQSGLPRTIKRWSRGQALAEAPVVFQVDATDMMAYLNIERESAGTRTVFTRALDFYNTRDVLVEGDRQVPIDKPSNAAVSFWGPYLLLELRSDWTTGGRTYKQGSLLIAEAKGYLAGERRLQALFTPGPGRALSGYSLTRSRALLNVLDNVSSRVEEVRLEGIRWVAAPVKAPFPGAITLQALHDPTQADDPLAEHYLLNYVDFLTPQTLWLARTGGAPMDKLKSLPTRFDATGMRVEQSWAISRDGTAVPYYLVRPRDSHLLRPMPTLMYGYGGFEVTFQPWYLAGYGAPWLERGGAFVLANIRGGGEFGPAWHQAALRDKRQRAFDDFTAVAKALVQRGITTPAQLGIEGGSNGGLLTAAVMLQQPQRFGAVLSQVPLLDMRRYHKLLAGASWMAEFGNPDDPADWAFISRYSPYHVVRPDMKLPPVFFTTSTRDDRVHPGHARKMVARMLEQGHEVLYYEQIEGGHNLAADNAQRAEGMAMDYTFLWQVLSKGAPAGQRGAKAVSTAGDGSGARPGAGAAAVPGR